MPPKRGARTSRSTASKNAKAKAGGSTLKSKFLQAAKIAARSKGGFSNDTEICQMIYGNEYRIVDSAGDGNCLFRSVSTCLTGSESHHQAFRQLCVSEILRARKKAEVFQRENGITPGADSDDDGDDMGGGPRTRASRRTLARATGMTPTMEADVKQIDSSLPIPDYQYFIPGEFYKYCAKMSTPTVWGGHLEIQTFANIFGITIIVLQDRFPPLLVNPDQMLWKDTSLILHLLYRGQCHYDAAIPADSRQERFTHNKITNDNLKKTILQRHKATSKIPFDLTYLEPKKQTFWLTKDAQDQCQMGLNKKHYAAYLNMSNPDAIQDGDVDGDEDDEQPSDPEDNDNDEDDDNTNMKDSKGDTLGANHKSSCPSNSNITNSNNNNNNCTCGVDHRNTTGDDSGLSSDDDSMKKDKKSTKSKKSTTSSSGKKTSSSSKSKSSKKSTTKKTSSKSKKATIDGTIEVDVDKNLDDEIEKLSSLIGDLKIDESATFDAFLDEPEHASQQQQPSQQSQPEPMLFDDGVKTRSARKAQEAAMLAAALPDSGSHTE